MLKSTQQASPWVRRLSAALLAACASVQPPPVSQEVPEAAVADPRDDVDQMKAIIKERGLDASMTRICRNSTRALT